MPALIVVSLAKHHHCQPATRSPVGALQVWPVEEPASSASRLITDTLSNDGPRRGGSIGLHCPVVASIAVHA
jgi:hypothetical protein